MKNKKIIIHTVMGFLLKINLAFSQIVNPSYIIEYLFKFKDSNNEWSIPEKYLLIGDLKESFYLNYNQKKDGLTDRN